MDDPVVPRLEEETRRRRRRLLFRRRQVPVRMLVPNFFTLLGLCAGLTSIRMGIEGRYDLALAAIVFAAALDGIDGRVARLLKADTAARITTNAVSVVPMPWWSTLACAAW